MAYPPFGLYGLDMRDESFTRPCVADIVKVSARPDTVKPGETVGQQHNNSSERTTLLKAMSVAGACGLGSAVSVSIGVVGGQFVDDRLRTSPWALLLGLFLGIAAGLYTVYLIIAPIVRSM